MKGEDLRKNFSYEDLAVLFIKKNEKKKCSQDRLKQFLGKKKKKLLPSLYNK